MGNFTTSLEAFVHNIISLYSVHVQKQLYILETTAGFDVSDFLQERDILTTEGCLYELFLQEYWKICCISICSLFNLTVSKSMLHDEYITVIFPSSFKFI